MNITEAKELYNKLHNPEKDKVKYHLVNIHNGISEAVYDAKYYVYYIFFHDDTEQTIAAVCNSLENNGFSIERAEQATNGWGIATMKKSYPARITIYGWVQVKMMSREQALRILKLLSGLEMYVFMQSNVPDHHTDELIKIIDDLTDIVLEKNK